MYQEFKRRQKAQQLREQQLAYNTAVCVLAVLGSALAKEAAPRFEDLFNGEKKPMSLEAMANEARRLNALFGGEVKRSGGDCNGAL